MKKPVDKSITVALGRQKLFAYEDGQVRFEFDCVSGDISHPTEPGLFRITRKARFYTSQTYKVPMNYAMFFTNDGKAIHESHVVGPLSLLKSLGIDSVGSHGCVRLAHEDAVELFDWAPIGTPVRVQY